jgi:tetratricopeptide (TPR) repeat protein
LCVHLDIEEVLLGLTPKAAPGDDFFMEHVHFTFAGHREVARALARTIVAKVLHGTWDPARQPSDDKMAHLCGITTYDHINALNFAMTIVFEPPFNTAPDHQKQFDILNSRFKDYVGTLPSEDQLMFADLDMALRLVDMINGLAAALVKRGELERALELFQTAQRRRPWEITAYVGAAKCLTVLKRPQEALACLDQALALAPHDPDLLQIRSDLTR